MDYIIKGSKIDKNNKLDLTNFNGWRLDSAIKAILNLLPERKKSNSVQCRSDKSTDAVYRLLGTVLIGVGLKEATYDLYLADHYFYKNSIVFKKKGKGGIGFIPRDSHIDNITANIKGILT